jgi:hypothetical protein
VLRYLSDRRPKKGTKANESADEAKARLDAEEKQERKNAKRAAKEAFNAATLSSPPSSPCKKQKSERVPQRCVSTLSRAIGQKGDHEGVVGKNLIHQISVLGFEVAKLNADPPVTQGLPLANNMFYDKTKKANLTKVLTPQIGQMIEDRVKERCPESAAVMDSDLTPPDTYVKPQMVVAKKSNMFVDSKLHAHKIIWLLGSANTYALRESLKKKWGFQYNDLAQEEDGIEKPFWWSDTTAAVLDEKDGLEAWLHDMGFTVLVHDLDNAESDSD